MYESSPSADVREVLRLRQEISSQNQKINEYEEQLIQAQNQIINL